MGKQVAPNIEGRMTLTKLWEIMRCWGLYQVQVDGVIFGPLSSWGADGLVEVKHRKTQKVERWTIHAARRHVLGYPAMHGAVLAWDPFLSIHTARSKPKPKPKKRGPKPKSAEKRPVGRPTEARFHSV